MIAARASSAFVCFRCELHIARPQLSVLSHHSRAAFSTSVRRRDGDETGPTQPPPLARYAARSPKPRKKARRRATTARLGAGVKTLGDDAEILVIKEMEDAAPEDAEDTPKPDAIPVSSPQTIDLLASLQDEARPLTLEEIAKQLDSLRPKIDVEDDVDEAQYVDQKTFSRLYEKLVKGFTSKQLSHYYSTAKGVEHNQVADRVLERLKQLRDDGKRIVERSAWHPGTTEISQRLPSLHSILQKRSKRNPITKKTLVDQILRDVWKLVLLEEIEAPGEIELLVEPWQLTLLQSGSSPTPLDRVGTSRRAKIQIHGNAIRITADKTTAEYAADDIEKMLHGTETKRFNFNEWIPYLSGYKESEGIKQYFPETALKTISDMTEVSVQVTPENTLSILGLGKSAIAEAEQCILKMLPLDELASQSLDESRCNTAGVESHLVPARFEPRALNFHWRKQKLGRWTVPQTLPEEHNDSAKNVDSVSGTDDVKAHLLTLLDYTKPQAVHELGEFPAGWASTPDQYLKASYGHVLFPQIEAEPEHAYRSRQLLQTAPGLPRVLTDGCIKPTSRLRPPVLNYNFVAAPSQRGFKKGQRFPDLRIQFRYADNGKYTFRDFVLHYNMYVHDVLLPDKVVDIRFMLGNALCLSKPSQNLIALACIEATSSNINNGYKLTAPDIELEIPAATIPGYESHRQDMKTVQYIFAGVRSRQSVAVEYAGMVAGITTAQGGKLSSKGTEVSTFFSQKLLGASENFDKTRDDSHLTRYIGKTFELAQRFTDATRENKSWTTRIKKRPAASASDNESTSKTNSPDATAHANLTTRNLEKGRNPNSPRAIRRRARFGDPSEANTDSASDIAQENESSSSQLQSEHFDGPFWSDVLMNDESVQGSTEEQSPILSPGSSDDAVVESRDNGASIKSPA